MQPHQEADPRRFLILGRYPLDALLQSDRNHPVRLVGPIVATLCRCPKRHSSLVGLFTIPARAEAKCSRT